MKTLAPVLAVTADEVWQDMRAKGWVQEPSVHLAVWPSDPPAALDEPGRRRWEMFRSMRDVVMKALEEQRGRGAIGSGLEARVTLVVSDPSLVALCEAHRETLAEAFVVSDVDVRWSPTGQPVGRNPERAPPSAGRAEGTDGGPSASPAAQPVPGLVGVSVERAPGGKCQRCWKHLPTVGSNAAHPTLCGRCARVVTGQPGNETERQR